MRGAMQRARYLRDTDLGRADGWWLELDGVRVGELFDPQYLDMFWDSYAVRTLAGHQATLADDDLWEACRFSFRSRGTAPAWSEGATP